MSAAYHDAAVVGGGPAGCSAAIRLAGSGARVVLYEARPYPHDKVCGEFLSPECRVLLAELGLGSVLADLGAARIDVASLAAPGGAAWETCFPEPAWGLSRRALDHALADRAAGVGADVRSGTSVDGIAGNLREGFTLRLRSEGIDREVRARVVIAAHGRRSRLDRSLDRHFLERRAPFVALKAHFQGPPLSGRIELNIFPGGYSGLSETEDGSANLGLLVHEDVFKAAGGGPMAIDRFVTWLQKQNPRLGAWLGQASRLKDPWLSVAQVPFSAKEAALGGVLFAGDAAGVIAPLAGDGIAMALRSGQLAGDLAARYLAGRLSGDALPRIYAARWEREFGPRLKIGRVLQPLLMQPRAAAFGLRLLAHVPALGRALMDGTRDLSLLDRRGAAAMENEL